MQRQVAYSGDRLYIDELYLPETRLYKGLFMGKELRVIRFKGAAASQYIPQLAELRYKVFRDYPYLYEGDDPNYEENYLRTYTACPESILVLIFDNDRVVGASTAIPLEFETTECQKPFLENNIVVKNVFYFGESVLLHPYRGQNIGKRFFAEREAAAREYGCKITAFCAVERPANDPRRPADYWPLDAFWQKLGYQKHPALRTEYEWKEIGESVLSAKPMVFWLKTLD